MIRALIELGAKADAENIKKETPLHLASARGKDLTLSFNVFVYICYFPHFPGHAKAVRALIDLGANIFAENLNKETPCRTAELNGEIS